MDATREVSVVSFVIRPKLALGEHNMKIVSPLLTILILMGASQVAMADTPPNALNVMTFNIRYDNPNDPNPWKDRKGEVAQVIATADIIGLQEALKHQIDDLQARLPDHAWFGVGRDDGKSNGEYTCLFYRKDRFRVLKQKTFWLSETPDVPGSKSWDTSLTRIVTWGQFKDLGSGAKFFVFNTHFDHRGKQAREESAKLIIRQVAEIAGDAPVVVMGDFNTAEYSAPYNVLIGTLKDARHLSGKATLGPKVTSTGWTELRDRTSPIDYIFVNNQVRVHEAENVATMFRGFYPSDHLPVRALMTVENE